MSLLLLSALALAEPAPGDADPAQIERWLDSVVMLVTGPGWCSGVVVDEQGTVATAYHCIASGRRPRVELEDGRFAIGRAIAGRPRQDIALVSVPDLAVAKGGPPPLEIRQDTPLRGARVYGLGHPYAPLAESSEGMRGLLRWSVTEGVVSNTGERYLQTDAALNPGNSGGPVVDADGRIVGIVSRKLGGDNLAFAVNAELLRELMAEPKPLSPFGGELSVSVGLTSLLGVGDALTWTARGTATLRDRVVLTVSAGLPSGAESLAGAFGRSRYPSMGADLGARARVGRGRWSTSLELGPSLTLIDTYRADEDGLVLPEPSVLSPGGYTRLEFGGLGVRVGGSAVEGELAFSLGVDLGAPIGHGTF